MSRLDEAREHLSERHKKFPPMPLGSIPVVRIPAEWVDKESEHVRLLLQSEADLRAALTQSAEQVARLERTVERMRPVYEASLMYHRKPMDMSRNWGDVWSAAVDDALKAASSPDHAGAPEGPCCADPKDCMYEQEDPPCVARVGVKFPSVEAGEGETT